MISLSNLQPVLGRGAYWVAGVAGLLLLAAFWGLAISLAEVNAVLLAASLVASAFILVDFRVGVVLLIVLMPISESSPFPHQMAGITGLNPLNLLLAATFGSYLLRALGDGSVRRLAPPRLLWLYLAPFVIAGVLGSRHVGEIAHHVFLYETVSFESANGYLRDIVLKPLFMVLFALLVGAAVARSREPEKFILPTIVSCWLLGLLVIGFVLYAGAGLDFLSGKRSRWFLSQLGLHANDLGRLYAVAYALLLFTWAQTRHGLLKMALAASMLLTVAALVLTFSRGAFFAFVVVNVLFVLTRRHVYGFVLGGLLVAMLMLALPGTLYDRVSVGFDGNMSRLTAGRIDEIWLPLLPELWRSPLIGNGLSSILWSDAMRSGVVLQVSHPHNAYLQTMLDMGIVGLALLGAFFALLLRDFRNLSLHPRLSPTLRGFFQGGGAGLVSFLVAAVAGSSLTPCPEQSFLWLAIGMMYGVQERQRVAAERCRPPDGAGKGTHAVRGA